MSKKQAATEIAILMEAKENLILKLAAIDKAIREVLKSQNLPL